MAKRGRPARKIAGVKKQFVLTAEHWSKLQRWALERGCTNSEAICEVIDQVCQQSQQTTILRAMTPQKRLQAASRLYTSARQLKAAALRAQHPDWTDSEIQRGVKESFLFGAQ